jgi:hypothetical protein
MMIWFFIILVILNILVVGEVRKIFKWLLRVYAYAEKNISYSAQWKPNQNN